MKTLATKTLLLGCLGLAIGATLPSCVEAYGPGYATTERVITYNPGYEVGVLPSGYRTEVIGGTRYYYHQGTYYRPRSGRYVVVEAPRTHYESSHRRYDDSYSRYDHRDGHRDVVITSLPRGYREINHRSGRYYQVGDVYYQQRGGGYVIVTRPY